MFIAKKYHEIKLPQDRSRYLGKLHSTTFFQYLIDRIEGHLLEPDNNFEQNLRLVLLFAHGGTISGFMTGIDHDVWSGPYLGSNIHIELFKNRVGEVFVSWKFNN